MSHNDWFGMHAEQPLLCNYPANESNLLCLCLFQNEMFLNFSTECELDSHLNMFSLGIREWEPMADEQMDEGGISLQCCVSMMRKQEVDLLYTDPCSRRIKKFKAQEKSVIIMAGNGSEGNNKGWSEFATFCQPVE